MIFFRVITNSSHLSHILILKSVPQNMWKALQRIGWVCPLGSFQEWLAGMGEKLFGRRCNNLIPSGIDNTLRLLRYGVLAWYFLL